jgi:hypothetical protein
MFLARSTGTSLSHSNRAFAGSQSTNSANRFDQKTKSTVP